MKTKTAATRAFAAAATKTRTSDLADAAAGAGQATLRAIRRQPGAGWEHRR